MIGHHCGARFIIISTMELQSFHVDCCCWLSLLFIVVIVALQGVLVG
jgi:hypothetical protein